MDLKSKYIEVNHEYYEVDDWFVDKLKTFPRKVGLDIAKQVDQSYPLLKQKQAWTQHAGGVCTTNTEPIYFEIEYLFEPEDVPIFLDIQLIEVDEYLDYIIENNIIKSHKNEDTRKRPSKKIIS